MPNWFKLSQLNINTFPEDVLIYYRGTALPLDNFTGEEMFTDDPKEATYYAEVAALRELVENNDELNEIIYDIIAEEGGDDITDLSPDTIKDIIKYNNIDIGNYDHKDGYVSQVKLKFDNPLDLTVYGSEISSKKELINIWKSLYKNGLLSENWEEIDDTFKYEIFDDYVGKAIYVFFQKENVYNSAFQKGFDAIIFLDQGIYGTSVHKTFLMSSPEQISLLEKK